MCGFEGGKEEGKWYNYIISKLIRIITKKIGTSWKIFYKVSRNKTVLAKRWMTIFIYLEHKGKDDRGR